MRISQRVRFCGVVGIAAVLFGSGLGYAPPATAVGGPGVSVSPNVGLHDASFVTITATGFDPDAYVEFDQCWSSLCDAGAIGLNVASTDASGSATVNATLERFHDSGQPIGELCGYSGSTCVVRALQNSGNGLLIATASLGFAPMDAAVTGAFSAPSVSVPGAFFDVSFSGWADSAWLRFDVCPTGASLTQCGNAGWNRVTRPDSSGAGTMEALPVPNCFVACELVMWDVRSAATAVRHPFVLQYSTSTTFAPTAGLSGGNLVTVSGYGWRTNGLLVLQQCETGSACAYGQPGAIVVWTDRAGGLKASIPVSTSVPGPNGTMIDCTAAANTCEIVLIDFEYYPEMPTARSSAGLTFGTIDVASQYSGGEMASVNAGAVELGLTASEFQRTSSGVLAFLLGLTGTTTIAPSLSAGATITSHYSGGDAQFLSAVAQQSGLTLGEFQKTSTLVVAYLLALG